MDIEINGKRVTLKDRMRAKESWPLVSLSQKMQAGLGNIEFDEMALLLSLVIESWEFDGAPSDIASYADLDLLGEMIPMMNEALPHITRTTAAPKN